jgi:hypothetical protein
VLIPYLSEYDQSTSSEGSLDPLGLYPIADQLASKLVPGFRERMRHPRYLTAIAAGMVICSEFDEDIIASDYKTEPWQIYEWYSVHALVTKYRTVDETQLQGLPGVEKATKAYTANIPLNPSNYLKMATVFGFHGVYRTLAKDLNLIDNNILGEFGDELIRTWEKEEKLEGFYSSLSGRGRDLRKQFYNAINDSLKTSSVARNRNWGAFYDLAEHIAPYKINVRERKLIYNKILDEQYSNRYQLIKVFESGISQKIWNESNSEKEIHKILFPSATDDLKHLLKTIFHYEEFARLLQDAFDSCLFVMSDVSSSRINDFKNSSEIINASRKISNTYEKATEFISDYGLVLQFEERFSAFAQKVSVKDWINLLFEHHETTQKNKLPNGKRPWFERAKDGRFLIYPGHRNDSGTLGDDSYVHYYRTRPLMSFLKDMNRI